MATLWQGMSLKFIVGSMLSHDWSETDNVKQEGEFPNDGWADKQNLSADLSCLSAPAPFDVYKRKF